jgi:hypothetical protein
MSTLPPIIGEDPAFLDVIEKASLLAPLDRPCLVLGERGTGKELVSARLHYLSRRRSTARPCRTACSTPNFSGTRRGPSRARNGGTWGGSSGRTAEP